MMTNLNEKIENFIAYVANTSMKMDAIESSQKTVADAVKTIENQQGELKNKVDDIPNIIEAQVKTQMEKCDAIHKLEKNIETLKREIQAIKDMSRICQDNLEKREIDDVKCLSKITAQRCSGLRSVGENNWGNDGHCYTPV